MKRLMQLVLPIVGRMGVIKYVALGIISGLCSFLFINMVSRVIGVIINGGLTAISKEYIIVFLSIILIYVWCRRSLSLTSINISLRISWNLRKQILLMVLNANYRQLSSRINRIQTGILNDIGSLTNASLTVIDISIATVITLSCFVYLASISFVLFLITLFVAIAGVSVYYFTSKANMKELEKTRKLQDIFQANMNAILYGFKEIFMGPAKGRYIYDNNICTNANESFRHNLSAITGLINNQIIGQILFYILISSVLLVFGIALNVSAADIVSYVFTLLYLLGSIESITVQLPTLMRAGIASDQLIMLRKELEDARFDNALPENKFFTGGFEHLSVRNLEFAYGGEHADFKIGPIDFDAMKGETVFIYGGNGSGKTTFMHALLGLYSPETGEIRLNGIPLDKDNYADYKNLFSVVFSDFYLFEEILGDGIFDMERWNYYLALFELEGKVSVEGKRLSTINLSTGQRKRLALILAIMENKPILVLDEWAADQDPHFRKKFYTRILPLLNKEGITIIAITHDDKYYSYADKLFKMDEGKLLRENINSLQTDHISLGSEWLIK